MYSDRGSSSCWLRRSPRDRGDDFLSMSWPRSLIAAAFAIAPLASPCAAEADAPMAGVRNAEKARVTITDARLQDAIDRRTIQRAAIERNPAVRASEQRATALKTMAKAEGGLPPPELMGQAWQVPFSRPTAFDSQMVMLGVTQSFPAPGVLAAKEQATAAQASEELAMASDKARMIMREAGRVFSDYLESSERYRLQRAQREIARHLVAVAEARHASGGALIDLTRAHVELARIQADVLSDATLIKRRKRSGRRSSKRRLKPRRESMQREPPNARRPGHLSRWGHCISRLRPPCRTTAMASARPYRCHGFGAHWAVAAKRRASWLVPPVPTLRPHEFPSAPKWSAPKRSRRRPLSGCRCFGSAHCPRANDLSTSLVPGSKPVAPT
jgi:hypothetical protein